MRQRNHEIFVSKLLLGSMAVWTGGTLAFPSTLPARASDRLEWQNNFSEHSLESIELQQRPTFLKGKALNCSPQPCPSEQKPEEASPTNLEPPTWDIDLRLEQPLTPLAQNAPSLPDFSTNTLDSPYTIGPGDRLQIDLFDVPEYSGEHLVLVDGTVNLPVLGRRQITNLNFTQLTELLQREYAPYIVNPIVTIRLVNPRPVNLTVSGEVRLPGVYTFGGGDATTANQFARVTKAIELAGGITAAADVHRVEVRRTYQGQEQVFMVDLWNLLQGNNLAQDPLLRDGDTVYIPTTEIVDPNEIRQLAQSSLAPTETASFQVAVVGEVLDPGTFTVNASSEGADNLPTVVEALRVAGGVTPKADVRQIQLRRSTRSGKDQLIIVNLWKLLKDGDISQDQVLQQGDELFVPVAEEIDPTELEELARSRFSPDTIRVSVAGEVASAGTQSLPANTTLNQAILAAGGFNQRAHRGSVELIRLNPNGTVSRRTIDVEFENALNEENNPLLSNNDIVLVNRSGFAKAGDFVSTLLGPVLTGAGALVQFPFTLLNLFGITTTTTN